MVDYVRSLRPMRGDGTRTQHTPFGVVRQSAAAVKARRTDLFLAMITKLYNKDYVGAMVYDDTLYSIDTDFVLNGGDDAAIAGDPSLSHDELITAKCVTGRKPISDNIDGFDINYTYDGENSRTAAADMLGSETQVCHPRYTVGDLIILVKVQNGTGIRDSAAQEILYYELQPGRYWCSAPDNYTPPET